MLFRRVGTQLIFNVTNPELLPMYRDNDAYEVLEAEKKAEADKPKKTNKKK